MTLFIIILSCIAVGWLGMFILCAMSLAGRADRLYNELQAKNKRSRKLGKMLRFHGKI